MNPNGFTVILGLISLIDFGFALGSYTILPNVSYGSDPAQIMDIYVPQNPNADVSKVIVLIHGGAWSGGSKSDMNGFLPYIGTDFPNYPVVNLEYRLGNWLSPGYPKQLQDIESALSFLKSSIKQNYGIDNPKFGLIGVSAGAHLSMFYAYRYDINHSVSAVVNVVGPVDFTDPAYANSLMYNMMYFAFIGPNLYILNPGLYKETSPVQYITKSSAPTISFYGDKDPLIPNSQRPILKERLDSASVPNQDTVYSGGHFDWDGASIEDMKQQITSFLNLHL